MTGITVIDDIWIVCDFCGRSAEKRQTVKHHTTCRGIILTPEAAEAEIERLHPR